MKTFIDWSPTRLFKYEACPLSAKLEYLDRLCPRCFDGQLNGYDTKICDSCEFVSTPGPALVRGSKLGLSLERYVRGDVDSLDREIKNPLVLGIARKLREAKKGTVEVELMVRLSEKWKNMTTGGWFKGKLDVLHKVTKTVWRVIDWKSGGIDKQTGKIRAQAKYDDQLELYSVATLTRFPAVKATECSLVFIDAKGDPTVKREEANLKRHQLKAAQKKWEKRVLPMLSDTVFAPRPSPDACRFCPYRRDLGGPCPV